MDDTPCRITSEGSLDCKYFKEAVLPLDAELSALVFQDNAISEAKRCKRCGNIFIPSSNRQAYCILCRKLRERESDAAKHRRAYAKRE